MGQPSMQTATRQSSDEPREHEFCVIGAGFAGLRVAAALDSAGARYVVLDKGRSPGGRAATRRISEARVDHGIPWLTRSGDLSNGLIDSLREAGLIERLSVGGSVGEAWSSPDGINSLAKHLAANLNVRYSHRVEAVEPDGPDDAVRISVIGPEGRRSEIHARQAIITAPVPQTLEMAPSLTEAIGPITPDDIYEKAVLGLARLSHRSEIPDRALFENPAEGIEAVIVESAKFRDRPPSVTIRCDPQTSDRLFDLDDEAAWAWMAERVSDLPLLAAEPEEHQVKRWRYSKPLNPVPAPFVTLDALSACGDGFDTGSETGLEAALRSAQTLLDSRAG